MMQIVLASLLSLALSLSAHARPINLPGALEGGVQVCSPAKCLRTSRDRETPVQILSFQDGIVNVRIGRETMGADPDDVVLKLQHCTLTMRSYLAKRYCPGWKPQNAQRRQYR